MNNLKIDPERLRRWSNNWKVICLMMVGGAGAFALVTEIAIFPIFLGLPTNGTTCQYALGAVIGIPVAQILKLSTMEG